MPFHAHKSAGGEFKPVPVGSHIASCTALIDLGIQGGGQFEPAHKVAISWQLPNAVTDAGKAMTITQTYTSSMNKKANLRKIIESWFGKTFPTEKAAEEFDLSALLGRSCLVNVVHKESNGKTFANVTTVMPLPAGFPKPAAPETTLYYAPTDPTQSPDQVRAAYANLPEWLRTKVDSQLPESSESEGAEAKLDAPSAQVNDDGIPF